jgi:hypothetical protein
MKWFPFVVILVVCPLLAQEPVPELTAAQKSEAVRLMDAIRKDPRGPYGPIFWYCKDGQKLPPKGAPCGKQGGFQHADPSAAAQRLAALDFDLARLLAGQSYDDFLDLKRNHYWLRELVMIDYLTARSNGWIYARTYSRRGVRQAEDEESEGRRLLTVLLTHHEWVAPNYLLAMLTVAAVPHGAQTSRVREIRALSASLADAMPAFQPLRGKIHSHPAAADVESLEKFIAEKRPADSDGFAKLLALMKAEYNGESSTAGLDLVQLAERSLELRRQLTNPGLSSSRRLAAADEQLRIQNAAFQLGSGPIATSSRRALLEELRTYLKLATGGGWLSLRQLAALDTEIAALLASSRIEARDYEESVSYLEGGAEWARATAEMTVGEVKSRYAVIEPLAAGLSDDLLRGSVMLPLANRIEALTRDSDAMMGRNHRLLTSNSRRGIRALNPGIAIGRLEILDTTKNHYEIEPDRIYVIPATVAELKPMKGILTLDSGNALSHAQLLAANLGIPNATVPSSVLPELRKHAGSVMFYAVTPKGTVVLRPWDEFVAHERAIWEKKKSERGRISLDTSKTNTADARLRLLEETSMADSGVLCGPKAANLGQLKRLFPDLVAPGVVVPFGVYFAHASRKGASGTSITDRVSAAYAEAERMRSSGASPEALRAFIRPRLEEIRSAIRGMTLDPEFIGSLNSRMRQIFGPDRTYGVFVRSDTNSEDLPQFTGAGLNLTVPNVVGETAIANAIKDVWASPFEERAWAWRFEALQSSDRVYPSVVLLRTVPSDKSGVMATANLSTLDLADLTVNVSEGVAAVVDGGVSESLLLRADGTVRLLAQARAPYKKVPRRDGGFGMTAVSGSDFVLTETEIPQLRSLAREVKTKLTPARDNNGAELPWDIEFGFEKGELRLFQIRPLVRYREARVIDALSSLESNATTARPVSLDMPLTNE